LPIIIITRIYNFPYYLIRQTPEDILILQDHKKSSLNIIPNSVPVGCKEFLRYQHSDFGPA